MGLYPNNAAAGAVIPSGAKLSPGGLQGPAGDVTGVAVGGDLVGTLPNPTLELIVTAGVAGDATHVARVAWDAKGRIVSVSTVAIQFPAGGSPGGAAGGSLAGTYPNPTLSLPGVVPGIYGSGGSWPILTITSEGRISSVATATPTLLQRSGLLGSLIGASFSTTADQTINMASTRYRVTHVIVENTSPPLASFNTNGNIYETPLKSGHTLAGAVNWNDPALATSDGWFSLPISTWAQSHIFTANPVYMSLSLAQPTAGTGNIWIFGESYA